MSSSTEPHFGNEEQRGRKAWQCDIPVSPRTDFIPANAGQQSQSTSTRQQTRSHSASAIRRQSRPVPDDLEFRDYRISRYLENIALLQLDSLDHPIRPAEIQRSRSCRGLPQEEHSPLASESLSNRPLNRRSMTTDLLDGLQTLHRSSSRHAAETPPVLPPIARRASRFLDPEEVYKQASSTLGAASRRGSRYFDEEDLIVPLRESSLNRSSPRSHRNQGSSDSGYSSIGSIDSLQSRSSQKLASFRRRPWTATIEIHEPAKVEEGTVVFPSPLADSFPNAKSTDISAHDKSTAGEFQAGFPWGSQGVSLEARNRRSSVYVADNM